MGLDLTTLLVVSQLVSIVCGVLFAIEAVRWHSSSSWWFAGAFSCAPLASVFYILATSNPQLYWGYPLGNAIATMTMGLTWIGARSIFERTTPYRIAVAVPFAVLVGVLIFDTQQDAWSGALPFFLNFGAFSVLAAIEFWRGKEGEPRLQNATILTVICALDALLYLSRAFSLLIFGRESVLFQTILSPEASAVTLLLLIVIASFSLVALGKERAYRSLEHRASHDSLTDLLNRRAFFLHAERELEKLTWQRLPVSVLLLDLDYFKHINDEHGHLRGDEVLTHFAHVARVCMRESDILCRYGGEEFAALLPDTTGQQAFDIAERIRTGFAESGERKLDAVKPTTSIGVASAMAEDIQLRKLLERADKCLYHAKLTGRNKTVTDVEYLGAPSRRGGGRLRTSGSLTLSSI